MRTQIQKLILAAALVLTTACSKTSSNDAAAAADATATSATALSIYMSVYSLALGASGTVTATGGSGTYSSAAASQGTIYQASNGNFIYTAPASSTVASVTITVTDSLGQTASTYVSLTGITTTTTTTTSSNISCAGTYSATVGGNAATIVLVDDSAGYASGYVYMFSYYYPVFGSCTNNGSSGTIALSDLIFGWSYSGTTSYASGELSLSGSLVASGYTYSWSAASQTTPVGVLAAVNSCEGNYNAVIGPNAGTIVLVQDGYNRVAGYLSLQGYYYALSGTCSGTSISLSNLTSGSPYTGSVTISGANISMSGTFTTTAGASYAWSATKY